MILHSLHHFEEEIELFRSNFCTGVHCPLNCFHSSLIGTNEALNLHIFCCLSLSLLFLICLLCLFCSFLFLFLPLQLLLFGLHVFLILHCSFNIFVYCTEPAIEKSKHITGDSMNRVAMEGVVLDRVRKG